MLSKWITGYEYKYSVSPCGEIMAHDFHRQGELRALKTNISKTGYHRVGLRLNGVQKMWLVHRLVATAFIPNPNNYPQINHKDGDKSNNKISNLEWCDQSQNTLHAYNTGLMSPWNKALPVGGGEDNNNSKLTRNSVMEIRNNTTDSYRSLSIKYGVGKTTIAKIKTYKSWRELTNADSL